MVPTCRRGWVGAWPGMDGSHAWRSGISTGRVRFVTDRSQADLFVCQGTLPITTCMMQALAEFETTSKKLDGLGTRLWRVSVVCDDQKGIRRRVVI
jgi:hypothetical protein